jgi:rod shape-determining protein MreC
MRRKRSTPYFFLIGIFFLILSLPPKASDGMRSFAITSLAPSWRGIDFIKKSCLKLGAVIPTVSGGTALSPEALQLRAENEKLRREVEKTKEWLVFEGRLQGQIERLKTLISHQSEEPQWKEFLVRRSKQLAHVLDMQLHAMPARVIFRDPALWSSFVWVGVGERDNEALGKAIVAKNSPVISGSSIVGVVEYVGKSASRVRLITDSRLVPSVRAVRGSRQNRQLLEQLEAFFSQLQTRGDLFSSKEEIDLLMHSLAVLKSRLSQQLPDAYLAKGELSGASRPLWRLRGNRLKGVGFNFNVGDEEGEARDLRTGELLLSRKKESALPILKEGDLLITTGLDGVFPPDLNVAIVSEISPLREGACAYELEALPTAGNLSELSSVVVLPPLESVKKE